MQLFISKIFCFRFAKSLEIKCLQLNELEIQIENDFLNNF